MRGQHVVSRAVLDVENWSLAAISETGRICKPAARQVPAVLPFRFGAPPLALRGDDFQFRDPRAKAATDKTDSENIRKAQQQLGHNSAVTTEPPVRKRRGQKGRNSEIYVRDSLAGNGVGGTIAI